MSEFDPTTEHIGPAPPLIETVQVLCGSSSESVATNIMAQKIGAVVREAIDRGPSQVKTKAIKGTIRPSIYVRPSGKLERVIKVSETKK